MEIPNSRFHEVSFNECKLSGVDWTQAHWPEFNLSKNIVKPLPSGGGYKIM